MIERALEYRAGEEKKHWTGDKQNKIEKKNGSGKLEDGSIVYEQKIDHTRIRIADPDGGERSEEDVTGILEELSEKLQGYFAQRVTDPIVRA